jgi:hypothetical protein
VLPHQRDEVGIADEVAAHDVLGEGPTERVPEARLFAGRPHIGPTEQVADVVSRLRRIERVVEDRWVPARPLRLHTKALRARVDLDASDTSSPFHEAASNSETRSPSDLCGRQCPWALF